MVTEYYNKVYQQKVNYSGENLSDKAISRGVVEFDRYLATTPTRQQLLKLESPTFIDGEYVYASIQGPSSQNATADRYEKIILGALADNFKIGDILKWHDENWIITTQERLSIPTHFKGKVRFCNYYLKWNIQGTIYTVPGHVITSRAYALEEGQKAGIIWDESAMVILAIIPSNEITRTIQLYHRFIIKNKAWKVVSTDELSVENLLFVRLEEDQINLATDDLDNQIADKYTVVPDTNEVVESVSYSIDGVSKLKWNSTSSFSAKMDGVLDTGAVFTIAETDLATVASGTNPVTIRANSQGIVGDFTLRCVFSTDKILEKIVKVNSLWGD